MTAPVDRHSTFACSQCRSSLEFEPGSTELVCRHCGFREAIEVSSLATGERDYLTDLSGAESSQPASEVGQLQCTNCGASFRFDAGWHAGKCPFCATPAVVDSGSVRQLHPGSLLPFAFDKAQARECFAQWLARLWFVPSGLKKLSRVDGGVEGVYLPYWTFDARVDATYSGERGIVHHVPVKIRRNINGREVEQLETRIEVRWTPVRGTTHLDFDDLAIPASKAIPIDRAQSLEPWDFHQLVDFKIEYLSGFRSALYTQTLAQGFDGARRLAAPQVRAAVQREIGGDQQRIHQLDAHYFAISYRLALLPVWLAAFRFRAKTYQFSVNARTGEVRGERPYSWVKIGLAAIAVIILLVGVGLYSR